MKGIIFNVFNQLVEEKFGLKTWQELVDSVKTETGGAYTASGSYADTELFGFVKKLSDITQTPTEKLLAAFGEYTLHALAQVYPDFFKVSSPKEFLKSIHNHVHVTVKRLYPDAKLPTFDYEDPDPNSLVMIYRSERKLCHLAEGLIQGTAQHFKTTILQKQTACLHQGHDHCRFELKF